MCSSNSEFIDLEGALGVRLIVHRIEGMVEDPHREDIHTAIDVTVWSEVCRDIRGACFAPWNDTV